SLHPRLRGAARRRHPARAGRALGTRRTRGETGAVLIARSRTLDAAAALGLGVLVSAPWSLPLVVDAFWVTVLAETLLWGLFAASVNLLFGYVGLLSFGQALYFGMGAYGVALGVQAYGLGFWPAFGLGVGVA